MAKARMATLLFDLEKDPGQTVCEEDKAHSCRVLHINAQNAQKYTLMYTHTYLFVTIHINGEDIADPQIA
jgi:hypothetical protein